MFLHVFGIIFIPLHRIRALTRQTKPIMITIKIFKTTVFFALMTFTSLPSQGQDLLARQAPVDRKMKAVDSIVLNRLIEQEVFENPAGDLYEEWDNQLTHYNGSVLPDETTVDLRGFCMPTPSRVITSMISGISCAP